MLKNQTSKRTYTWLSAAAFITSLTLECAAYLNGKDVGCGGGGGPYAQGDYIIPLGVAGVIFAVIGLVIASRAIKAMKAVGVIVLVLSILLAIVSFMGGVRICY
jgi:hypothetical protein